MNTRKTLKANIMVSIILIIVLIAALVVGIIFSVGNGMGWSGFDFSSGDSFIGFGIFGSISGDSSYSTDVCKVDTDKVRSIDIGWAAGQVNVCVTEDTDVIDIQESGNNEKHKLCWKLDNNGILKLRYTQNGHFISGRLPSKTLSVKLPKDTSLTGLEIDSASGGIVLSSLSVSGSVKIGSASGNVNISSLSVGGTIKFDNASGKIETTGLSAKIIDIDTASGGVSMTSTVCDTLKLDSASGGVYFDGQARDIDQDSASGKGEYRFTNIPDKVDVDCASGDVVIYLPKNAGFDADIDSASGRIDTNFPSANVSKKSAFCTGDKIVDIDMDSASGDLSIRVSE